MATKQVSVFGDLSADDVAQSLRGLAQAQSIGDGMPFMKLDKNSGKFMYGAEAIEVDPGERWAVNPVSFHHGYIGWQGGQVVGEVMVPISSPKPNPGELTPPIAAKGADGWQEQVTFTLKSLEDDTEAMFKTSTKGGRGGVSKLAGEMATQVAKNPAAPIPVIHLVSDSYPHKQYGQIYFPVFKVVGWMDANGNEVKDRPKLV